MNQPCGIFLPACFLWKHPSVQILMHLMEESSQSSSHWQWSDMIWYKMLTRFKKMCQLQVHLRKNGSWFDIKNMSNSVVVLLPNILVIPALSCMLKYSSGVPGYQSRGLSGIWHGLPLSVSPVATWRRANLDGQTGWRCMLCSLFPGTEKWYQAGQSLNHLMNSMGFCMGWPLLISYFHFPPGYYDYVNLMRENSWHAL